VFASQSRLRWAHDAGLPLWSHRSFLQEEKVDYLAGLFADQDTIALAHELTRGLLYLNYVVLGAAASGCISKMNWVCTQRLQPLPEEIIWHAASSGSLDMLQLVNKPGFMTQAGTGAMRVAVDRGYLHLCEYLREQGCEWESGMYSGTVANSQLGALRWLRESGCPWNFKELSKLAARHGSIEALCYLQQQQSESAQWDNAMLTEMLNSAGACNQLAAAQWLRHQGAEWPDQHSGYGSRWSADVLAWATTEGYTAPV
jgi:hypothetical protein